MTAITLNSSGDALVVTAGSACLARYRRANPVHATDGLTTRQAAELERITARLGRTTWRPRSDRTVLVAIHGDHPADDDQPRYLILATDGTIARPAPPAPRRSAHKP